MSAFRWRVGRQTLFVLPFAGVAWFVVSLVVVGLALLVVDRGVLVWLEQRAWTAGEQWARHNRLVEQEHRRKALGEGCAPHAWEGQPLPPLQPDRRRILVLGDSFVWGPPYATLNHLWWRQLQIELAQRGYRHVDVLAAGRPGWSTRDQLACARQLVPQVRPDLILWGYVTNDPDEKVVPQIFDTQDQPPYGQRVRRLLARLLPNLSFKFESLRARKLQEQYAGPRYGFRYPDWEAKLVEGENLERYRQTVAEAGAWLKSCGIPCVLQTLPSWPSTAYHAPRYAPVLPLWEAAGVPVHNILAPLTKRFGEAPLTGPQALVWGINPADSHPGPRMTHLFAVMAADYLETHHRALLGPQERDQPLELAINDWLPAGLNVQCTRADERSVSYAWSWPGDPGRLVRLPLGRPGVRLALRWPVALERVELAGEGLQRSVVRACWLAAEEGYDENEWSELGRFTGRRGVCEIPPSRRGRPLTQLCIEAEVDSAQPRLQLTLWRAAPEDSPGRGPRP
jgi:hypothetical protein